MSTLTASCESLPVWTYEPGDVIIQEDRKDRHLFILKKGAVEITKRGQTVSSSAAPGSIFGEISALLDTDYSASVIATEPCEFYVAVDGEAFLRETPELNLHISKLLAYRLQRVTGQLAELREEAGPKSDSAKSFETVLKTLADQFVP